MDRQIDRDGHTGQIDRQIWTDRKGQTDRERNVQTDRHRTTGRNNTSSKKVLKSETKENINMYTTDHIFSSLVVLLPPPHPPLHLGPYSMGCIKAVSYASTFCDWLQAKKFHSVDIA